MQQIDIDTIKIRECGKDIISLSIEMKEIIDTMFKRINNINISTGEWLGDSADLYIKEALIDKIQYLNMQDSIYKNGKYLIEYSDNMERIANEVRQ